MIYKNFSKYDIDIENGTVFSLVRNKQVKLRPDKDGYKKCGIVDDKGNRYCVFHQVVFCAANGITKDEFPIDEKGERYTIDHILPIKNGGRDIPSNLHLVSRLENMRNPITRKNMSESSPRTRKKWTDEMRKRMSEMKKGMYAGEKNPNYGRHLSEESKVGIRLAQSKKLDQIDPITGEVIKTWNSIKDACEIGGFCRQGILCCCRGEYSHHHNFIWRRHKK